MAELEEQVKLAEPLQQAYSRSEERCVQLVEVTQQWAIECEEKVRMIEVLEKEADQLKGALQQLDATGLILLAIVFGKSHSKVHPHLICTEHP